MHAATHDAASIKAGAKSRALLISRLAMLVYFLGIGFTILVREPRDLLVTTVVTLVPTIVGPGAYRFVGIFAALASFLACALIQCS
jgi:hypothetical protein